MHMVDPVSSRLWQSFDTLGRSIAPMCWISSWGVSPLCNPDAAASLRDCWAMLKVTYEEDCYLFNGRKQTDRIFVCIACHHCEAARHNSLTGKHLLLGVVN